MQRLTTQKLGKYGFIVRISEKLSKHLRENHREGESASRTLERLVFKTR